MRFELRPGRHAWIQVAQGSITLNGEPLRQGDGAAAVQEDALALQASENAEILVFNLA